MSPIPKLLGVEELLPASAFSGRGVFTPTATTRLLCSVALDVITPGDKVLDLGCGSGIIGLEILRQNLGLSGLCMSDISPQAVQKAQANARSLGLDVDVRTGSLFQPWLENSFDVIVSDVSGVIPEIGAELGWFDSVPNDSGDDGTALAGAVIAGAPEFLSTGGVLLMPAISLSDEAELLNRMRSVFSSVSRLAEARLPLPREADASEMQRRFPSIRVGTIGRLPIFYTSIWKMTHPRGGE